MNKLRERDHIEMLAILIEEALDKENFNFCMDFDSNKMDGIEFGRKIARKYRRNVKSWEKVLSKRGY